jgi:hypothetical protein
MCEIIISPIHSISLTIILTTASKDNKQIAAAAESKDNKQIAAAAASKDNKWQARTTSK